MLSPDYLAVCANDIVKLYSELEDSIIGLLSECIANKGYLADYSVWQAQLLQESGMLYDDIIKQIGSRINVSDDKLTKLFKDAGVRTILTDNTILAKAGLPVTPIQLSPTMTQILVGGLDKTKGQLKNLTLTTAVTTQQAYINACNMAYMQVAGGYLDYTTAVSNAVGRAISDSCMVRYPTGHQDKLSVAVRRSVLTGVNQTAAAVQLRNLTDLGTDLVEVTAHAGARPDHAEWQGKVYSITGKTKGYKSFYDETGYGTGPGLCGWNCRHNFFPFFEGISGQNYTEDELKELASDAQYNERQKMRQMERAIQKARKDVVGYEAAINETDDEWLKQKLQVSCENAKAKLGEYEAKYKQFASAHKLPTRLDGKTSIGKGKTGFDNSAKRGKIKSDSGLHKIVNTEPISITDEVISGLKTPECSLFNNMRNSQLRQHSKEVLKLAQKQPINTEVSMSVRISNFRSAGTLIGEPGAGRVGIVDVAEPFISIHNHPDGNIFTIEDIQKFIKYDNMRAMIAVGNDGSYYIVEKVAGYDKSIMSEYLSTSMAANPDYDKTPQAYVDFMEKFMEGMKKLWI